MLKLGYLFPNLEKSFRSFHEMGFNLIRFGIFWDGVEPQPGVYDMEYLKRTLYNCTYLPIHYYQNGHLQLVLPDTGFPFDLAVPHLSELVSKGLPISYLATNEFHYIGLVNT